MSVSLCSLGSSGDTGAGLVNTYAAISIMTSTPGWNPATSIYTDENGGEWLRTGVTMSANPIDYPYAGTKTGYTSSVGLAPATNYTTINNWHGAGVYDFNVGSGAWTGFVSMARYTYNNNYGVAKWSYPSRAGNISNYQGGALTSAATQIYSYNGGQTSTRTGLKIAASGNNMIIQFANATVWSSGNPVSGTAITITNGNLNNQNRVRGVYYVSQSANANIHVVHAVSNNPTLSIYAWNGSAYTLSSTVTLTKTGGPYSGDIGPSLRGIDYDSATGRYAVSWNGNIIVYSNPSTIIKIFPGFSASNVDRVRAFNFSNTGVYVGAQTSAGLSMFSLSEIMGDESVVNQSVLNGSSEPLYVFKKIK